MRIRSHARTALLLCACILVGGCTADARAPRDVTSSSAVFTAVGSSGCGGSGEYRFEYATSRSDVEAGIGTQTPTRTFDETPGACDGVVPQVPVTEQVTGLTPDTTYHYRLCGRETGAFECTSIVTFTTDDTSTAMPFITADGDRLMAGADEFRFIGFNSNENSAWNGYLQHPSSVTYLQMIRSLDHARALGGTVARVHLQLFDFVDPASTPGDLRIVESRYRAFETLLEEAEQRGVYLDVIGNNVWLDGASPDWYDEMSNEHRWDVQAFFFAELARRGNGSPAILCYELTNEPGVTSNVSANPDEDWYGGSMGGYHFTQRIARGIPLGQQVTVAQQWMTLLRDAILAEDPDHLVTVGGLPFANGPFGADEQAAVLPLLSVHIYPQDTDSASAIALAQEFGSKGKPSFIGETSVFQSTGPTTYTDFLDGAAQHTSGIVSFFPGVHPDDIVPVTMNEAIADDNTRKFVSRRDAILAG